MLNAILAGGVIALGGTIWALILRMQLAESRATGKSLLAAAKVVGDELTAERAAHLSDSTRLERQLAALHSQLRDLEEDLDACSHDPDAVRRRLRGMYADAGTGAAAPPAAPGGMPH